VELLPRTHIPPSEDDQGQENADDKVEPDPAGHDLLTLIGLKVEEGRTKQGLWIGVAYVSQALSESDRVQACDYILR